MLLIIKDLNLEGDTFKQEVYVRMFVFVGQIFYL